MTDFQVVPDDVDTFSSALRDLAGQAGAAGAHVTKWFTLLDAHTGIFVKVKRECVHPANEKTESRTGVCPR